MMTPEFKAEFVIVIDMSEVPCVCVLIFEIIPQKVRVSHIFVRQVLSSATRSTCKTLRL